MTQLYYYPAEHIYKDIDGSLVYNVDDIITAVASRNKEILTSQTGAVNVMSYIPTIDNPLLISGGFYCSAYTSGGPQMTCTYTPHGQTSTTTIVMSVMNSAGTIGTSINTTGPYTAQTITIYPATATSVTIAVAGTFVATYDVFADIKQP